MRLRCNKKLHFSRSRKPNTGNDFAQTPNLRHRFCSCCDRRIPNGYRRTVGEPAMWPNAKAYGDIVNRSFEKSGWICSSCHNKLARGKYHLLHKINRSTLPQTNAENNEQNSHDVNYNSLQLTSSEDSFYTAKTNQNSSLSMFSSQCLTEKSSSEEMDNSFSQFSVSTNESNGDFTSSQKLHSGTFPNDESRNSDFSFASDSCFSQDSLNSLSSENSGSGAFINNSHCLQIKTVVSTEKSCFLCANKHGRLRIPKAAVIDAWIRKEILIPRTNRSCAIHLSNGIFTNQALELIRPNKDSTSLSNEEIADFFFQFASWGKKKLEARKFFDFEATSQFQSEDYKLLLGLSRAQFEDLYVYVKDEIRNSSNRSSRNALAIFLIKMRLNLPQSVIAFLFGVSCQPRVSETIDRVMQILLEKFVPNYLGYGQMTREQCKEHQTNFCSLLNADDDVLYTIIDGTYIYVQKSSDIELQQKTFSGHKHRNLVKPMMVVLPDGYILEVEGMFFANGYNNDAAIFKSMLKNDTNGFMSFFKENDHVILDRGFRDAINAAEDKKLRTSMPSLLQKKQKQFTTTDANQTRLITMIRWIVESANGRLKNVFKIFDHVVPTTYLEKIGSFVRICAAILNAYYPKLFNETEEHRKIAELALEKAENSNLLQENVITNSLGRKISCWLSVTQVDLQDFPQLGFEQIKRITLGIYQLNMAERYCFEHTKADLNFKLYFHKETPTLLRCKMKSRFRRSTTHQLWLEYNPDENTEDGISSWYCVCCVGSRTVGCCSHIASIIWFLAYYRHQPQRPVLRRHTLGRKLLDAAEICADQSSEQSDSDDSD